MDINHDGKLSKEELVEGYTKIYLSKEEAENAVNEIMKSADADKNGNIDFSEFVVATSNKKILLSDELLTKAF